ncbi:MAG: hypothetical protein IKO15_10105 [Clostridiales bacterium]|nr:hypothetical protein [Clostridiales bacterium]
MSRIYSLKCVLGLLDLDLFLSLLFDLLFELTNFINGLRNFFDLLF